MDSETEEFANDKQATTGIAFNKWLKTAMATFLGDREFSESLVKRVNERHLVKLAQVEFGDNHMTLEEMLVYIGRIFPNNLRAASAVLSRDRRRNQEFHKFVESRCRRTASASSSNSVQLRVACFGCGPGSECLALMSFLKDGGFRCSVHFQLYDLNDWSDALAFFLTDFATISGVSFTSAFFKTDVVTDEFVSGMSSALKDTDLFILSKFACQIHTNRKKSDFYDALFSAAKDDAFFVLIDRCFKYEQRSDILADVENVARRYGFEVSASSFLDIVDCEEIDAEKGRNCTFRFIQKRPLSDDSSLRPTWSKRPGAFWKHGRVAVDPRTEAAKPVRAVPASSTDNNSPFAPDFMVNHQSQPTVMIAKDTSTTVAES